MSIKDEITKDLKAQEELTKFCNRGPEGTHAREAEETKMKTANEAAMDFLRQHWHVSPSQELEDPDGMEVFLAGDANGFQRAIEMLRDAGKVIHENTGRCVAHNEWADWLEAQEKKRGES